MRPFQQSLGCVGLSRPCLGAERLQKLGEAAADDDVHLLLQLLGSDESQRTVSEESERTVFLPVLLLLLLVLVLVLVVVLVVVVVVVVLCFY